MRAQRQGQGGDHRDTFHAMEVIHEPSSHRFVVRLPGGQGELLYSRLPPAVLDLYHAEVSPGLRGQGVAARLVEAACEYARASGSRLIPSCPYVAWWFRQHPEKAGLLAE